ncbi:MAG: hypothetical protein WAW52_06605 [Methanothrix sp.]
MDDESIIEIINEAEFNIETADPISTQRLILDACACTGNCPEN